MLTYMYPIRNTCSRSLAEGDGDEGVGVGLATVVAAVVDVAVDVAVDAAAGVVAAVVSTVAVSMGRLALRVVAAVVGAGGATLLCGISLVSVLVFVWVVLVVLVFFGTVAFDIRCCNRCCNRCNFMRSSMLTYSDASRSAQSNTSMPFSTVASAKEIPLPFP